jgi:hypothetical protein
VKPCETGLSSQWLRARPAEPEATLKLRNGLACLNVLHQWGHHNQVKKAETKEKGKGKKVKGKSAAETTFN